MPLILPVLAIGLSNSSSFVISNVLWNTGDNILQLEMEGEIENIA